MSRVQSIINRFNNTLTGEPWFGRAVYPLLEEVDAVKAEVKPNGTEHSMLELLYHMITWNGFALKRIEKDDSIDMKDFENLDWRKIDLSIHSWEKGLAEFKSINSNIISLLEKKNDDFLDEIVDHREYNFRFLIHGMIDHTIYHVGQIAYLNKLI